MPKHNLGSTHYLINRAFVRSMHMVFDLEVADKRI
jgi:hypothetical protein